MATSINTLQVAQDLKAAGLAPKASEAIAHALAHAADQSRETLVTKDFLKAELAQTTAALAQKTADLDSALTKAIADGDSALTKAIADGDSALKTWMLTTIIGSNIALVGALVLLRNFTQLL